MGEGRGSEERGRIVDPEPEAALEPMTVLTPGGRIEVHWEPEAAATGQPQWVFFGEFLKPPQGLAGGGQQLLWSWTGGHGTDP